MIGVLFGFVIGSVELKVQGLPVKLTGIADGLTVEQNPSVS